MSPVFRERACSSLAGLGLAAILALLCEQITTLLRGPLDPAIYVGTMLVVFASLAGRVLLDRQG